jgi:hypothetical protein
MGRAQAHTLEAFVAGLLVLSGIVFALQATAVTPLSASTSNQHVGNQQRAAALGVLQTAAANDTLEPAILEWNATDGRFANATEEGYHNGGPPGPFGHALNQTFSDQRTAFNVDLYWSDRNGSIAGPQPLVDMGTPSDDATVASRSVVVYNDTRLTGPSSETVAEVYANGSKTFYAPDAALGQRLYNVVEVRITVWRI